MRKINKDYNEFLNESKSLGVRYDYTIIDPPWKYNDIPSNLKNQQLSYELWQMNDLSHIFEKLETDYLFIWVTNSMLIDVFRSNFHSYKYKTMITWSKLTSKGNLFYGLGHHFRNNTEHLMYFTNKNVKPLKSSLRNFFQEPSGKRTIKPKNFEKTLIEEFQRKSKKGLYIFSGPCDVFDGYDIDCVDICL